MAKVTLTTLNRMKAEAEKFTCLTAYDYSFAKVLDNAGVEVILVGDSLGMVMQGQESTVAVDMNDMIYHTKTVSRAVSSSMVMADMPFMSYPDISEGLKNGARLMREGGAHIVKLEVTSNHRDIVAAMADNGIPVCAHLGLLPQSVHKMGGYKVQGKDEAVAQKLIDDTLLLQDAGADMFLFECIPAALAKTITETVNVPVIGIGAGVDTDAQVLVLQDMLGITPGKSPKFSMNFLRDQQGIPEAIMAYVEAVKLKTFPGPEHTF
jgi:3-methyl-2-oxobutanoate hydroxymethyltransferase